ncbi:hypothetical protein [Microcystis phage Mae-JY09]
MRSNEPWTRGEALVRLQAAYGDLGRAPKRAEWARWGCTPSAPTLKKLFGSWQEAWEAAAVGLDPSEETPFPHRERSYPEGATCQ